jgi:hypothetical protein
MTILTKELRKKFVLNTNLFFQIFDFLLNHYFNDQTVSDICTKKYLIKN